MNVIDSFVEEVSGEMESNIFTSDSTEHNCCVLFSDKC